MPLISVTRLRIRSIRFLPGVVWDSIKSNAQAKQAPGNLDSALRAQGITVFWTLTAWEDEASMQAFMRSGAHREAMPKLQSWCDEGSVVHWQQDSAELPTWAEAEAAMAARGRFTPLLHPSPAHQQKRFSH